MAVPKKDGSLRLCVDYRKLNKATEQDAYPIPCMDDIIDQLGQAPFITTIDLNQQLRTGTRPHSLPPWDFTSSQ